MWAQIIAKLATIDLNDLDYITFVGNGEPCLSLDIGWCIQKLKSEFKIPIAVITNGSLLHDPTVQHDLMEADLVLPTYDAGTEGVFRRVNRPHHDLSLEKVTLGMQEFRKQFRGKLWVEIMLVAGINEDLKELHSLSKKIQTFFPDETFINAPVRPPAESWVRVPSLERMQAARKIFPEARFIDFLEQGEVALPGETVASIHEYLIELVKRHPLRKQQLLEILTSKNIKEPSALFNEVIACGSLQETKYNGHSYIQYKSEP